MVYDKIRLAGRYLVAAESKGKAVILLYFSEKVGEHCFNIFSRSFKLANNRHYGTLFSKITVEKALKNIAMDPIRCVNGHFYLMLDF